jgi:hypothetical protein
MSNFFNKLGTFVRKASNAVSDAYQQVADGYKGNEPKAEAKKAKKPKAKAKAKATAHKAATKIQFSSEEEQWFQVVVTKAELKGSVIFVTGKDAKTSKSMVMTLNLSGQYRDSQTKKLGILLAFMGQCPKETVEEAVAAINEAPEKRLLVLLKAWSSDPTLANIVRVQAHDHKAKTKGDEPKVEVKPKAKKGKGKKAKQLDESC